MSDIDEGTADRTVGRRRRGGLIGLAVLAGLTRPVGLAVVAAIWLVPDHTIWV